MFYDFNGTTAQDSNNANPYENNPASSQNRRCFSKGGDRVPTRERGMIGTRQNNIRRSIMMTRGGVGGPKISQTENNTSQVSNQRVALG